MMPAESSIANVAAVTIKGLCLEIILILRASHLMHKNVCYW